MFKTRKILENKNKNTKEDNFLKILDISKFLNPYKIETNKMRLNSFFIFLHIFFP